MHNFVSAFCIVYFASCIGCSIPILEPQSCIDSRTAVREFYSYHFGNGLAFGDEDLDKRGQYLTPAFFKSLRDPSRDLPTGIDPFTLTNHDPPKAFRVGACKVTESGVQFNVLLFWKTDTRTEQRSINVDAENINGRWLISAVK